MLNIQRQRGLVSKVREEARAALLIAVPLFANEPPLDKTWRVRIEEGGSYTEEMAYRGYMTLEGFSRRISSISGTSAFLFHVTHDQPEILGHRNTPGSSAPMPDATSLLAFWCAKVFERASLGFSLEVAIEGLLNDVHDVLLSGSVRVERRVLLHGLEMPNDISELNLLDNLIIRRVTESDRLEANPGFTADRSSQIARMETNFMLVSSEMLDMTFSIEADSNFQGGISPDIAPTHTDHVLRSLHIIRQGRVAPIFSETYLLPDVLPFMGEISRASVPFHNFRRKLLLDKESAMEIPSIFIRLGKNRWSDIHVAAGRLADASSRFSDIDALVDAMVGLEVLLNAGERGEMSFRAALNYAFLGEPKQRRERYDILHALQKVRNKVLHGGIRMDLKHANEIRKAAADASDCLRDVLRRFLTDDNLYSADKKDSKFWVDRMFAG